MGTVSRAAAGIPSAGDLRSPSPLAYDREAFVLGHDLLDVDHLVAGQHDEIRRHAPYALVLDERHLQLLEALLPGALTKEVVESLGRVLLAPAGLVSKSANALVDVSEERLVLGQAIILRRVHVPSLGTPGA